jgi:mRNA-degrading endonuclease toxin of MazEF toxin-antitoxin module
MSESAPQPRRGDIWFAQHSPTRGREQRGDRPCLVVSHDLFNAGPAGWVVACPMTTTEREVRWHVDVSPPEANLDQRGFVMSEAVRSMAKRRSRRRVGAVEASTLERVEQRLRVLLEL